MVQHHYLNAVWIFVLVASLAAVALAIVIPYFSKKLPRDRRH